MAEQNTDSTDKYRYSSKFGEYMDDLNGFEDDVNSVKTVPYVKNPLERIENALLENNSRLKDSFHDYIKLNASNTSTKKESKTQKSLYNLDLDLERVVQEMNYKTIDVSKKVARQIDHMNKIRYGDDFNDENISGSNNFSNTTARNMSVNQVIPPANYSAEPTVNDHVIDNSATVIMPVQTANPSQPSSSSQTNTPISPDLSDPQNQQNSQNLSALQQTSVETATVTNANIDNCDTIVIPCIPRSIPQEKNINTAFEDVSVTATTQVTATTPEVASNVPESLLQMPKPATLTVADAEKELETLLNSANPDVDRLEKLVKYIEESQQLQTEQQVESQQVASQQAQLEQQLQLEQQQPEQQVSQQQADLEPESENIKNAEEINIAPIIIEPTPSPQIEQTNANNPLAAALKIVQEGSDCD